MEVLIYKGATEIRSKMAAGDDSWKDLVMPGAAEAIEKVLESRKSLDVHLDSVKATDQDLYITGKDAPDDSRLED